MLPDRNSLFHVMIASLATCTDPKGTLGTK
jgi:hypothetical protein